jgi:hypothetical protein
MRSLQHRQQHDFGFVAQGTAKSKTPRTKFDLKIFTIWSELDFCGPVFKTDDRGINYGFGNAKRRCQRGPVGCGQRTSEFLGSLSAL